MIIYDAFSWILFKIEWSAACYDKGCGCGLKTS